MSEVRLDDLLRPGNEAEEEPTRHRSDEEPLFMVVAKIAVIAAGLTFAAYWLLHLTGLEIAYPLLFSFAAAGLVVRRAVGAVREPEMLTTKDLVRQKVAPVRSSSSDSGWHVGSDGLSRAVMRWEQRLEWTATERLRFETRMPGLLGELLDERLRQHHGITRASHPERARALCGEALWTFLHRPLVRTPTPRELELIVKELEAV